MDIAHWIACGYEWRAAIAGQEQIVAFRYETHLRYPITRNIYTKEPWAIWLYLN